MFEGDSAGVPRLAHEAGILPEQDGIQVVQKCLETACGSGAQDGWLRIFADGELAGVLDELGAQQPPWGNL